MGVNLTPIVQKRVLSLEDLRGMSFAVDANNEIYQFLSILRKQDGTSLTDSSGNITSHLIGLLYRSTRLIHDYQMKIVFVFDGRPPKLKMGEIEKRRKVKEKAEREYAEALVRGDLATAFSKAVMTSRLTGPLLEDSKHLLRLLGVPYVEAPQEAEAQAAFMAQEKAVWGVGSRDYDSLLFGAPRLVRYLTIQGREFLPSKGRSRRLEPELIETARMLEGLGITRNQLIDVAILIGTDFNKGVRGVGPKTALKLIRQYGMLEGLLEKHTGQLPSSYQEIRRIFLEPAVRRDFSTAYTELNEAGLLEFLCDQRDFNRDRVKIAIARMKRARVQLSLKKWIDVQ